MLDERDRERTNMGNCIDCIHSGLCRFSDDMMRVCSEADEIDNRNAGPVGIIARCKAYELISRGERSASKSCDENIKKLTRF